MRYVVIVGMLSTSDHHPPRGTRRPRSPPSAPYAPDAPDVFTASPTATPASKRAKTGESLDPSAAPAVAEQQTAQPGEYASWLMPPQTPSRRKASSILQSYSQSSEFLDDIGRKLYSEGAATGRLDELAALGQSAHRLFAAIKSILDRFGTHEGRLRFSESSALRKSKSVQTATSPDPVERAPAPPAKPKQRRPRAARRGAGSAHQTPETGTAPRQQPAPLAPPGLHPRAHPRDRPGNRLIVGYDDPQLLRGAQRPHPSALVRDLNGALGDDAIAAVSFSRNDRLVVHTKAPFTAQQLALKGDLFAPVLARVFKLSGAPRPVLEPDTVWSKLVVHGAPLPIRHGPSATLQEQLPAYFDDLCSSNGIDPRHVRRMSFLCRKGEEAERFKSSSAESPQRMSVLLCFSDGPSATRLLKSGVCWQNSFCRVSRYRERQPAASG
ncbi:hypothetical protein EXIGLDRAFT_766096 [Exidia glandulosa HHB12029]|uniref:Uncharacterized protein n=1 Tax=Exidia glandulosa HHB12029 TaxID=1314781 RepID=A0A165JYI4_EXIGL|nr:hypothetical protein EXIGLDRAFT_766096 [Exidia glandulosa HHB12029]